MSMKKFRGVVQFIHPGAEHMVVADGWWREDVELKNFEQELPLDKPVKFLNDLLKKGRRKETR